MNGVWQKMWPEVPCNVYERLDEVLPLVTRGIVNQAGLEVDSDSVEIVGYILEKRYQMRNQGKWKRSMLS
jgi:hypothetical protein